jgi:hypothetical protein
MLMAGTDRFVIADSFDPPRIAEVELWRVGKQGFQSRTGIVAASKNAILMK